MRKFTVLTAFVALSLVSLVSVASAQIQVEMTTTLDIGGTGNTAYDFFYTASDGAEFTTYELIVQISNASGLVGILDPIRGTDGQQDVGSDAIDTFANTVGSFLGAGNASYNFTEYNPGGFSPDPVPAPSLTWAVFDTLTGDGNSVGGGAPFHLARILTTPDAIGTVVFDAFDTLQGSVGTGNQFILGIPEPTTLALAGLGLCGLLGVRRRRS